MAKRVRATFEGFRTGPDQLLMRIPGVTTVEVFRSVRGFKARNPETGGEFAGINQGTRAEACRKVEATFDRKVNGWAWFDNEGNPTRPPADEKDGMDL